jgi:hypothetical protein
VFGIDISKDNLENRLNGACARFLNYRKDFKHVPSALFVNGNSGLNIRSGLAMMNDKAGQITKAVFGNGPNDAEKLGKGVAKQYGKGENGFNVSSCQFAIHYLFENQSTFQNFIRNVSECTALNGYFIGTTYDGKLIFNMLKKKKIGESVELYEGDRKIWEIRKEYDEDKFDDDVTSLGYKIEVFQETINKMFPEYLVNFDYLERVMGNYGFQLLKRDEAKLIGLPEGSGSFVDLFNMMDDEVKRQPMKKEKYGSALNMTPNEKKISFLNRYFVFKKISHVNAEKIALESVDESFVERKKVKKMESEKGAEVYKKALPKASLTEKSKKAKPLNKKILLLSTATEAIDENPDVEEIKEEVVQEVPPQVPQQVPPQVSAPAIITKKPRAKKLNFVIETDLPAPAQPTEVTTIKESETPGPATKAKKVASKKLKLKLEE